MRIHSLLPGPQRENNMGGRFTKRPFGIHNAVSTYLPCSLWSRPPPAGPRTPARKSPRRTGATPLFLALVRARASRGFHSSAPFLRGRSRLIINPCRKAVKPMRRLGATRTAVASSRPSFDDG